MTGAVHQSLLAGYGIGGNDANTLLLIHMDGADASTTFTDSSASARTVTANGNAQIDTAQSVFGGASGLFDGTGDYLSIPDSADWQFSGVNFTIDFRARINSMASANSFAGQCTDGNNEWRLYVTAGGTLTWEVYSGGVLIVTMASSAGAVTTATWYHIAVTRASTTWTVWLNGASVATTTDADVIPNFTGALIIGAEPSNTALSNYNGWLDEFRISNVARWTTAFTPPQSPYSF